MSETLLYIVKKRSSRNSTMRIRQADAVLVGPGGVCFSLVDRFHRRHDAVGSPAELWVGLALLGCGASFVALLVDYAHKEMYVLRVAASCSAPSGSFAPRWFVWMASAALPALAASLLVHFVCPGAAGSGE